MSFYTFNPAASLPPAPVVPSNVSQFVNYLLSADAAVKASPGRVFSLTCENVSGPVKFLQLHNIIGAIPALAVPKFTIGVPAGSTAIVGDDFFTAPFAASPLLGGLFFSVGIRWGWSTTRATYTAAGAATQATQILFV